MPFTDSVKTVDVIIADKEILDATPEKVLTGTKFIGKTQHIETGSIPINQERTSDIILGNGETFNIPFGYNPLAYNITVSSLEDNTFGTATPSDIIYNKTAWVNGVKITGTMPVVSSEEIELDCGTSYTIEAGFHNGLGIVRAKSLMSQTKASIVPEDILEGSNCWANGEFIEGTMPKIKDFTYNLVNGEIYNIPKGYHSGNGKVTAPSLGIETPGTATPDTIAANRTAWVNGEQITGTMPSNPDEEIILPMNGTYEIPYGYHTGLGKVTQNIPSKPGQTIGPTKDPQIINVSGYYMEGDITVSGVDALNYQRLKTAVTDSTGTPISDYDITAENGTAVIKLSVDNWHDNATLNIYNITGTLVNEASESVNINSMIVIDWTNQSPVLTTLEHGISATIELEGGTNAHMISITGIQSGNITITEIFSAREFGIVSVEEEEQI